MAAKYIFRNKPDAPIHCKFCKGSGVIAKAGSRKDTGTCQSCHGTGRSNPLFSENSQLVRVKGGASGSK